MIENRLEVKGWEGDFKRQRTEEIWGDGIFLYLYCGGGYTIFVNMEFYIPSKSNLTVKYEQSLAGYNPWGLQELDMTENARIHAIFK